MHCVLEAGGWWWFAYDAYGRPIFVEGAYIAASGVPASSA
jgi:hypothetical protein